MAFPEFRLDDKVAIVVGGGGGIGRAIATALAEGGADIVIADINPKACAAAEAEINGLKRRCLSIPTDITKSAQVEKMVKTADSQFGKIDILVNAAGTIVVKPLVPLEGVHSPSPLYPDFETGQTENDWHKVIDVNLNSVFLCCRAVGPYMIKQRKGKIINLASAEAARAAAFHTSYAATKGAVRLFTQALALEWARYNINVNAIGPGPVRTDMMSAVLQSDKLMESYLRNIPLRRFATPREIALLAVYLACEASDYVTGQTVFIDGGFLA